MPKIDRAEVEQLLEEVRPDTDFTASENFAEDGLLDSFDIVTLVSLIDEKYGVDIVGRDILPENFSSVESIATLIENTMNRAV
jgi:acyl carrier protein